MKVDFVENSEDFRRHKERLLQLFETGLIFENNPFHNSFKYFLASEFDFIYDKIFLDGLKLFIKEMSYENPVYYTIDPSPEDYFYKHFKRYSVFEFTADTSDEELNGLLMKDPGNSPADALAIRSDVIGIYSNSNDWAILAFKHSELVIAGFTSIDIKNQFLKSFGTDSDIFTTI